jgi:alpha-galactosidase
MIAGRSPATKWAISFPTPNVSPEILFNRGSVTAPVSVSWDQIGLAPGFEAGVRDLWVKKDLGKFKGRFTAKVDPHDVVMVRIE